MSMKRRGLVSLAVFLIFLVATIVYGISSYTTIKEAKTIGILGEDQLDILETANAAESTQLYIDTTAAIAADEALKDIARTGGPKNDNCMQDRSSSVWTSMKIDEAGMESFIECYPSMDEIREEFKQVYQTHILQYFDGNTNTPSQPYVIEVDDGDSGLQIIGMPRFPLQFAVGSPNADIASFPEDISPSVEAVIEKQFRFSQPTQQLPYSYSFIGVPLHYREQKIPIDAIVVHSPSSSSLQGMIAKLRKDKNSYHFVIDTTGVVYQLLPEDVSGIHSYCENKQGHCKKENMNERSIAIAVLYPYSETQLTALIALSQQLTSEHNILQQNFLLHSEVNTLKSDPRNLNKEELLKKIYTPSDLTVSLSDIAPLVTTVSETSENFGEDKFVFSSYEITPSFSTTVPDVLSELESLVDIAKNIVEKCEITSAVQSCIDEFELLDHNCDKKISVPLNFAPTNALHFCQLSRFISPYTNTPYQLRFILTLRKPLGEVEFEGSFIDGQGIILNLLGMPEGITEIDIFRSSSHFDTITDDVEKVSTIQPGEEFADTDAKARQYYYAVVGRTQSGRQTILRGRQIQ